MSSKLTNKKLDLLIEQVLMEKSTFDLDINSPSDGLSAGERVKQFGLQYLGTKGVPNTKIRSRDGLANTIVKLISMDGDKTDFTYEDVEKIIEVLYSKNRMTVEEKQVISLLNYIASNDYGITAGTGSGLRTRKIIKPKVVAALGDLRKKYFKGKIDPNASPEADPEAPQQTITKPRFMTSGADRNASSFFGHQNQLIRSVFKENTIVGRCKKMSEISRILSNKEEIKKITDPRMLLQYVQFADLIYHIVKEMDARTAGYNFESLCALICGGNVTGGDMGAGDFTAAGGAQGSSKFLKSYSASQAASNFKKIGDLLHYIVATKEDKAGEEVAYASQKINKINLYYIIVQCLEVDREGGTKFKLYNTGLNKEVETTRDKDGRVVVTEMPAADSFVGSYDLYASGGDSYIDVLKGSSSELGKENKKALDAAKTFFKEIFEAEQNTKSYVSGKDFSSSKDSGNKALQSYDKADSALQNLLLALAPEDKKITTGTAGREITENKNKSVKDLDKLIERVILESMNKK